MFKRALLFLGAAFFFYSLCFGAPVLETKDFILSIGAYLREDVVSFKNVVDLDSHNTDDTVTYLGIDYNLNFNLNFKNNGPEFYLKLERNGPFDYDAPLFTHHKLLTSGGVIQKYRGNELLPCVEEFWLDAPLRNKLRFRVGLYTYTVGNGFSLNGSYENYGFTVSQQLENFIWNVYYCRPGINYKNRLGPYIQQERDQDIFYTPNAANFFAGDIKFSIGDNAFEPYVGVLADYTSFGKRNNIFTAEVNRDILGTFGLAWDLNKDKASFSAELAHNFGKAKSADSLYKDISHTGYLVYAEADYRIGRFIPAACFLLASGNKVTTEMAENGDTTFTSGKNRAFSYSSPLNSNLSPFISDNNVEMLPVVAMGGGNGLNYGLPRPTTFSAGDFDNLILPCLKMDWNAKEKLLISFYFYYLSALEKGVGMLDGEARYLSRDLGKELDLSIDWKLNKNILFSFLGGYFFPGRFYKEKRDDTTGSPFTPFVRGDGDADNCYQVELSMEFSF